MASSAYQLPSLLGAAALALALPACATTPRPPSGSPAPVHAERLAPPPYLSRGGQPPEAETPPPRPEILRTGAVTAGGEPVSTREQNPFLPGTGETANRLNNSTPDLWDRVRPDLDLAWEDARQYYSAPILGRLALGVALAAPLANTPADNSIQRWYLRRVSGRTADDLADGVAIAGQVWIAVPVGLEAAALAGAADEGYAGDGGWYEWGNRSLRALAVGYPPVLVGFVALGASRPDRGDSRWHPFQDVHGVSGHSFVGAVPFLTAAAMTEDPLYRYPLVLGSFLTGWARLHEDRHYFSQAALGWWMAYLAVKAVDQTQSEQRSFSLIPMLGPDGAGAALELRY